MTGEELMIGATYELANGDGDDEVNISIQLLELYANEPPMPYATTESELANESVSVMWASDFMRRSEDERFLGRAAIHEFNPIWLDEL
jgi:hypothetical protein